MKLSADPTAPVDWAEEEFGGCKLPDARLQKRLLSLARDFYARPMAHVAQACYSRAKAKAAYRFLDHEQTTMHALLQPHYRATAARVRAESIVLAVQDNEYHLMRYRRRARRRGNTMSCAAHIP